MIRTAFVLASFILIGLGCALTTHAQEELPPYKRLLTGEDAKRAGELEKQIAECGEQDDYRGAIKLAEELLDLRMRIQGREHWQSVDARLELQALKIVGELPADNRRSWRSTLDSFVEAVRLQSEGQFAAALAIKQQVVESHRLVYGPDHPFTAAVCNNVAMTLNARGQYVAAEALFRQALATNLKSLGDAHPETATTCSNVGFNLYHQNQHAAAEAFFQQALAIRRAVLGEGDPVTTDSYNNSAANFIAQGKYAKAEQLQRNALAACQAALGENHAATADSHANLAMMLFHQGRHHEAEPLLQRALTLHRRLGSAFSLDTARICSNLALVEDALGKHAAGEPLHRQALDIYQQAHGAAHPQVARIINSLATNLNHQGRYSAAEQHFELALAIRRQVLGADHPLTAQSLNNLAFNLNCQDQLARAEALHRRALALTVRALGTNHADTAGILSHLAANLNEQGKFTEAEPLYRQALAIRQRLLGASHPDTILSCNHIALNLYSQGKHDLAEPLFHQALKGCQEAFDEVHPKVAIQHNNLLTNLCAQGRYTEAAALAKPAIDSLEASRLRALNRGLDRAVATDTSLRLVCAAAFAQIGQPDAAWSALESHLGRGLLDEFSEGQALQLSVEQQQAIGALTGRLEALDGKVNAVLSAKGGLGEGRLEFEAAVKQRRSVAAELGVLAASLQQAEILEPKQMLRCLPSDTALVTWLDGKWGGNSTHWAFLLTTAGPRVVELQGSGANSAWTAEDQELASAVRRFVKAPPRPGSDLPALCRQLYQQRLAPLEPHLKDVKHLIVLPSEAMAGIPLEALTDRFTISYAPSGTMLTKLIEARPVRKSLPDGRGSDARRLLAVGDPDYLDPFKPLPGTRREIEAIAALFPKADKLLGEDASKSKLAALKEQMKDYDVIHLAAHGVVNPHVAFNSAVVLSQGKDDNGHLTALEIKDNWPLKAELVVLSACESALGRRAGGEGYLGFSQALFLAGARSLILSQWQVDDRATALLMTRFYQNWLGKHPSPPASLPSGARGEKRMSKAEALKEAKHWLRNLSREEAERLVANLRAGARAGKPEDEPGLPAETDKPFAHPFYWSAFILIGDPE